MKLVRLAVLVAALSFVIALAGCQGFAEPGSVNVAEIESSIYPLGMECP